jgi:hypothetical protein
MADCKQCDALRAEVDNLKSMVIAQEKLLRSKDAENERLTAERDRQYDQNTEQITRIAALEAENEKLRAAIEPFALALAGNWSHQPDNLAIDAGFGIDLRMHFSLGDFRRARAALKEKVVAAFHYAWNNAPNDGPISNHLADAAIAVALAEAVRICDEYGVDPDCTAAIRALIPGSGS